MVQNDRMCTACIFPGQGSQKVGMGKALYDQFNYVKLLYDEVDEALSVRLSTIIFEGPIERLSLTEWTQPSLMLTSLALIEVLKREFGWTLKTNACAAAGHSLGEYTALAAVGAMSLTDCAKILHLRGKSMQQAVPVGKGAMAALMGTDLDHIRALLKSATFDQEVCELANDNGAGQFVISGHVASVDRCLSLAKDFSVKRAVKLNVSAPFHCALMQPVALILDQALEKVNFMRPILPIYSNCTAQASENPTMLKAHVVQQTTQVVRWRETIEALIMSGVTRLIEIGPGAVLTGLNKRMYPKLQCVALQDLRSITEWTKTES